ncbi:CD276 antigen homolog [Salmo salar]|uniref:CD276 antigen homolog n=1 Tax=Salmo salar TaxID=8030 RepID=A0A1S3L1A8_SALSA|nr:CD276 antigen homolog [Salmo salar]|eukprot:XP_013984741.1 PREDICTED: CD276 antigen homolog [Salmo salar]
MIMVKALVQACLRLLWILTLAKCKIPDAHVTCLFSEDCVLPCNFKPSGNEIIRWYLHEVLLLSQSQQGGDQPPQDHRTRTYLIQDQLSRGIASLHLRQCGIKDRGRYRCLVNSTLGQQKSFVIMKVEAPIKMVTMEKSMNREIQCLSKDIFPAPRVQWSTLPPKDNLRPITHMGPNTEGLYSFQSTLRMFENTLTYICTVNSTYGSQSWRSSLQERGLIGEAGQELSIPCIAPQNLQNFSLTWTFSRTNDPTVILSYDSRTRRTSNLWVGRAGLKLDQVLMGDGSLFLHNPESREQTGTYTCTFTGFQSRHVVQTQVNIRSRSQLPVTEKMPKTTDQAERTGESHFQMLVIVVVVAVVVAAVITALLLYRKLRANQRQAGGTTVEDTEMQPTETIKTDDSPMDNCQLTEYHNNSYN